MKPTHFVSFIVRAFVVSLIVAIVALGLATKAHAQAPTGAPAGAPAATGSVTTPPAAATAKVVSISPKDIASDSSGEIRTELVLRGSGLRGANNVTLVNADGDELTVSVVDNANDRLLKLSAVIEADDDNEYIVNIGGQATTVKFAVKNQATVQADKAKAAAAAAAAKMKKDLALGVQASKDVQALQERINVLTNQVSALQTQATATNASVSKVVEAGAALEQKVTSFKTMLDQANANATTTATGLLNLSGHVANLAGDVATIGNAEIKSGVFGGKKPLSIEAAGRAARIQAALAAANAEITAATKQ